MIVKDSVCDVERGGDLREMSFTIEASAAAFEILSAGIYKDRVGAPIRELSANAYDAHVSAATTHVPFEIHVPNTLEPYFKIRDFGIGLSPKEIEELYTRYFKSTKTNSNDLVGCKGLGSKTPFAYVESFTVISYYNSKKYIFNCYKNSKNCPATTLLGEEDTDEPNGLEVSFPVKRSDFYEFERKIESNFQFFKLKPTIKGSNSIEFSETKYLIKTEDYGVLSDNSSNSCVVMGNIAYPFDVSDFYSTSESLSVKEAKLVNWGIHLFVPIGSVETAASREKLTYTPETRITIKTYLAKALADVEDEAYKKLAVATNVWEARCLIAKIRKGILGELADWGTKDLEWQGQKINDVIKLNTFSVGDKPQSVQCLSTEKETFRRRRRHYSTTPDTKTVGNLKHWEIEDIYVGDLTTVFVNDATRGCYSASNRYMEENSIKKAIMLSGDVPDSFIESIGFKHLLVYISSLPKPERQSRQYGSFSSSAKKSDRSTLRQLIGSEFINSDVELSDGGVYIDSKHDKIQVRNEYSNDFEYVNPYHIDTTIDFMKELGFSENIYGIRPCDMKRLNKHADKWTSFDQAVKDIVKDNEYLLEQAILSMSYQSNEILNLDIKNVEFDEESVMGQAISILRKCKEARSNSKVAAFIELNKIAKVFNIIADASIANVKEKLDNVTKSYPLLDHISWWGGTVSSKIIEYVSMIDEKHNLSVENAA